MKKSDEGVYRVGVIGCGRQAITHATAYAANPRTEIVAAADPDTDNLDRYCDLFEVGRRYGGYAEMLAAERIDVAAIVVPTRFNPDAVLASAGAGVKAIFCEKPMAASLEDADRLVAECRTRGIKFSAGDAYRNYPQLWSARRLIESGGIGKVHSISVFTSYPQISGGGCQTLSVMRMFAGDAEVDWLTGWVAQDPFSDDDQGMGGYIRFVNGIECFYQYTEKPSARSGLEVLGSKGVFYTDWRSFRLWTLSEEAASPRYSDLVEVMDAFPDVPPRDGEELDDQGRKKPELRIVAGVQSIVDSLDQDIEPLNPGENMREVLEIAIAFRESHRRGHSPVKLPLEDRSLRLVPIASRYLNKKEVMGRQRYSESIARQL
jgi:predicted dehydrogenase